MRQDVRGPNVCHKNSLVWGYIKGGTPGHEFRQRTHRTSSESESIMQFSPILLLLAAAAAVIATPVGPRFWFSEGP